MFIPFVFHMHQWCLQFESNHFGGRISFLNFVKLINKGSCLRHTQVVGADEVIVFVYSELICSKLRL